MKFSLLILFPSMVQRRVVAGSVLLMEKSKEVRKVRISKL